MSSGILVNVDNFVRAESDRMLADLQAEAGAVNTFGHRREPADVAHQTVIRMNRDTLYSYAVVDLDAGPATVTLPDSGNRFMSLLAVDQDKGLVYFSAGMRTTRPGVRSDNTLPAPVAVPT